MKSAVNKNGLAAPSVVSATSPLSHIPLPKRKNASKGEKSADVDDTDSEMGSECIATRSQAKMSLLGSTSFCCTSGQKEDYVPDGHLVPALRPPKKRPPNISIKKEGTGDHSATSTPLLSQGKGFFSRTKKDKVVAESTDGLRPLMEVELPKSSPKDNRSRTGDNLSDSRLRQVNDRRKITPPSPQRRSNRETVIPGKEKPEPRKCPDSGIKTRKDSHSNLEQNICKVKQLTAEHSNIAKSCTNADLKAVPCGRSSVLGKQNKSDSSVVNSAKRNVIAADSKTVADNCGDYSNANQSDDFDCPCCDRASNAMDESGDATDMEIKMFTSCDVISPNQSMTHSTNVISTDHCDKERALQLEIKSLKEDLEEGKQKLLSQQDRVRILEEELVIMRQLNEELEKEKELRKIAEDKLLELLDHERRIDILKRDSEKHMESKSTQMELGDTSQTSFADSTSPVLLSYEARLRKYQTYIAKLENDNLMLVNELKKFKDMSPRSQEEQAKILVDKLGQMERNNHQQQVQYETCLDEVANKLVQTLLVQKRLEEECRVLHLRVEQLEHENSTLSELIDDHEKIEKPNNSTDIHVEISPPSTQNRMPSHSPLTSSPIKRTITSPKSCVSADEKIKESLKSANGTPAKISNNDFKSPVISPIVSPGTKSCSSKIPSFSTTKPLMYRKKSETEIVLPKPKGDHRARESATTIQTASTKSSALPSAKTKLSNSAKGAAKASCAKRKRPSRTESPADKDSKQRMKSSQIRWESRKVAPKDLDSMYKIMDSNNAISPIQSFSPPPQQVWSFNCEVQNDLSVPELKCKVNHSINVLSGKLDLTGEFSDDFQVKQNSSTSDASASLEGANRTRDEGYSTMSSDLQQDSTADTTISEPEHSSTFVISEKSFGCPSDDSVTECLDSSMCSSSDSGFGPLHQVANYKTVSDIPAQPDANKVFEKLPKLECSRKSGTVRSKEQIASVKPTIRGTTSSVQQSVNRDSNNDQIDNGCNESIKPKSVLIPQVKITPTELITSPIKLKELSKEIDNTPNLKSLNFEEANLNINHSSTIDCWDLQKEILGLTSYRNSWHLGSANSMVDEKIIFCTRHNYIDDNLFDEKVQTAEKSTLTEPEEELWREKALAPFIDESIWSLYSSEGDIQIKHFPIEPLLSEPSLEKLISGCSPCIIVSEDIEPQVEPRESFKPPPIKPVAPNSSATDLSRFLGHQKSVKFKPGLERVASDTVLYLKDAIHELEDSMRIGLKSSKNIPALHQNSGSESETSPDGGLVLKPEILKTLEATMSVQNNLLWPSPSRSSSLSSVQSSASCHLISDETEDVDGIRISRKGSQDPDLSSASDTEYENLEHKDFVERWLQKESTCNTVPKPMVSQLEAVEELGEFTLHSVQRKGSLPVVSTKEVSSSPQRTRFKSFPSDATPKTYSTGKFSPGTCAVIAKENLGMEGDLNMMDDAEGDLKLDPEATEFNGDFYTLCSIGSSLKSLDRFSPARTIEHKQTQVESPAFVRKCLSSNVPSCFFSRNDKSKPTGLVKPTRPISLPVSAVPTVPEHLNVAKSRSPQKAISTEKAKPNNNLHKVPASLSVFQGNDNISKFNSPEVSTSFSPKKTSPPPSLPVSCSTRNTEPFLGVKTKSPMKILLKSGSPSKSDDVSKRQLWRRDRMNSRQNRLKEGCGTAWIHLQPNSEISDPTVRTNLLESIKAPTSSSGSSSTDEDEEVLIIQTNSHLHRICRERRHRVKASANNPLYDIKKRSSIMGRRELFYRFGDKEREAIACFDFLEEIPSSSLETLSTRMESHDDWQMTVPNTPPSDLSLPDLGRSSTKERISFLSPVAGDTSNMAATSEYSSKMADFAKSPFSSYSARRLRLPNLWNKPLSHNMSSSTLNSQDCELLDHISLSDSCAESYSSTPESYDDAS